jgi:hypothetical protein
MAQGFATQATLDTQLAVIRHFPPPGIVMPQWRLDT